MKQPDSKITTTKQLTELQWIKKGFVLKKGAKGERRYTNCFHTHEAVYYTEKEVREDKEWCKKFLSDKRKEQRESRKEMIRKEKEFWNYRDSMATAYQWLFIHGQIPNENAEWLEGSRLNARWGCAYPSFAVGYYYCHESDVHEPKDEAELKEARERSNAAYMEEQRKRAGITGELQDTKE